MSSRRLVLCAALAVPLVLAAASPVRANDALPKVEMRTSMGAIVIELDRAKAPVTVDNFLKYVAAKQYDGTVFHRVINGFMIQGGGFDKNMNEKATRPPIKLEAQNGLKNVTGSIAMARTRDPNSATAQFFINVVDNEKLDYPRPDGNGYAVFGRVISGMDVVDKIKEVPTGNRGMHRDVPLEAVVIESVRTIK